MKRRRRSRRKEDRVKRTARPRRRETSPGRDRAATDRSLRTTPRQRRGGNRGRSSTMTRTGRTRPTSRGRVCSSSTMSEDTLRRRRDRKVETGSCGRTRVAGSTTASGRRNRRPRAARSSSPSTVTTSETAAAPETDTTGSSAGRDRVRLPAETSGGETEAQSGRSDPGSRAPLRTEEALRLHPPPPSSVPPSSLPLSSSQRSGNPSRPPPSRSRPSYQNQMHPAPQSQYRNSDSNAPQMHPRERQGPKAQSDPAGDRGVGSRGGGGRGPSVVVEDIAFSHGGVREQDLGVATTAASQSASPRRQQQEQRSGADRPASGLAHSALDASSPSTNREASPPTERPAMERKSYSLARRTRSRPADLGSKQPSVEESAAAGGNNATAAASPGAAVGGKSWAGAGDGPSQTGVTGGLAEMDQNLARLSLAGQSWSQSPTSYFRSEMKGLPNAMHIPGGPPPFSAMEEMGAGSNRAKRYSSQRQRAVPEPAPPMHLGVMEGHYYEPMSYQGPIYAHGDGPAPIPPQGMLVQPEMHIPHPGLHPHQSGGPIANPPLYGGPPVSLPPGQPQQLLPPPFYPPPGVMTFPYPTMYPTPQGQAQVTYGGVTYYDTMQQQAQPKPSPPPPHLPARHHQAPPSGVALRHRVTPPAPPSPLPLPPSLSLTLIPELQERDGRVSEELWPVVHGNHPEREGRVDCR
uniref:Casc3 exon junction complex subunit n=1 Tax=Sander lucioperca TaxID=283035 RepID=A0A8C9XGT8_SANLU